MIGRKQEIKKYLDQHDLRYQESYQLGNQQRLDFYLPDYLIGIKQQKEQGLEKQDDLKKLGNYCDANGIELIAVPDFFSVKQILDRRLLPMLKKPQSKEKKHYQKLNVWQATMRRLSYLFKHFDHLCVAFSGGKDSGIVLNLALMYAKEHHLLNHLAVYNMDYEAQYTATNDYVEETFKSLPDEVEKYWLCLPLKAQCAVNMEQGYWTPWEKSKQKIWARPMPKYDYVINEDNCEFNYEAWDYDVQDNFSEWFAKKHTGKSVLLVGIRSQESLNRQAAITSNQKVNQYHGKEWILKKRNFFVSYPIYDWETADVWTANARFGFKYNKLYDLFYQAGVSIDEMRVASPFNDYAKASLHLYRAIDPDMWGKLVGRVNGVDFTALYGNTSLMGWRNIQKPKGFTWKQYAMFLLDTMPKQTKEHYMKKLKVSIKSWHKGGARDAKTIQELLDEGAPVKLTGKYKDYGAGKKQVIQFDDYLDDTNVTDWKKIPTWKRFCVALLKNDWSLKTLGFSQNKIERQKRRDAINEFKDIKDW